MILVRTLVLVPIVTYFVYVLTVICPFYSDSPAVIPPDKPITSLVCSLNHHISKPVYAATIKPQVDTYVVPALSHIDARFGISHLTSKASQKAVHAIYHYYSCAYRVLHHNLSPTICAWTRVIKTMISLNIHAFEMTCKIALLRLKKATSAYNAIIYKRLVLLAYKRPWTRQVMRWIQKSHDASKSKSDFIRREWRRLAAYKDDSGFKNLALPKQQEKLSKVKRFLRNQLLLAQPSLGTRQESVAVASSTEVRNASQFSVSASDSFMSATNYGATPSPEPTEGQEDFEEEPLTVKVVKTIFVHASVSESTTVNGSQNEHATVSDHTSLAVGEMVQPNEMQVPNQIENVDSSQAEISSIHPMKASITQDLQNWNTRINRTFDMAAESIESEMNDIIGSIIADITDNISNEMRHVSNRTQQQYAKMHRMIDDINRDYGIMQTERDPDRSLADRQAMRDLIAYTKPLTDHTSRRVQDILTEKHSIVVDEYFKVIQRNIDTLEMFADVTAADFSKALGSKLQWLEQEDPSQGPFIWKSWADLRQLHERIFEYRDHLFDAASQYKINKPSEASVDAIGLSQWNDFLSKVEFHLNLLVRENLEFLALVRARANLAYQAREQLAREIVASKEEQEKLEQEKLEQERLKEEELEQERLEQERLEQEKLEQNNSGLGVSEKEYSNRNGLEGEARGTNREEVHANNLESERVENYKSLAESDSDEEYDPTTITVMHTVYVPHNSSQRGTKLINQTHISAESPQVDLIKFDVEQGLEDTDQTSDSGPDTDVTDPE